MGVHPRLKSSSAKHVRIFSKYLKGIENDLRKLGCNDYEVDIVSAVASRTFADRIKKFFGHQFDEPEETLVIRARVHNCPVEIAVPLGRSALRLPYRIFVKIPVSMTGRAECRSGILGSRWHCEPADKRRSKDLGRSLPKIKMTHTWGPTRYKIEVGSSLEPLSYDTTEWMILSGYEGGLGRDRPRVRSYLGAIPAVTSLLRKWQT